MSEKKNILDHIKPTKVEVPDASYFQKMAEGIIAEKSSSVKVIPMYKKPIVWLTTAAAAAIVAFVLLFNSDPTQEQDVLLALNDISSEDIQAYVEDNLEDFDTELIAEYIEEESIADEELIPLELLEDNTIAVAEPIQLDNVDDEDILHYFEEEEIDILELIDDESFI